MPRRTSGRALGQAWKATSTEGEEAAIGTGDIKTLLATAVTVTVLEL